MISRAVAVLLVTTLASACTGSSATGQSPTPTPGESSTSTAAGTVHDVAQERGNHFSPDTLTLKVGDTVRVTDRDPDVPHTFTVRGLGDSGTMTGGSTFTLRFDRAGTFRFVCRFHEASGMTGTITVR